MKMFGADFWRSLVYFNGYRTLVALLFFIAAWLQDSLLPISDGFEPHFIRLSLFYLTISVLFFIPLVWHRPRFMIQLAVQVVIDISCLTGLAYFSGGVSSSLLLLLLITIAAAALVSRGKITLFFAAVAALATLSLHSYDVLYNNASGQQFMRAGFLSMSYFAVAWLAHILAKNAVASQALAQRRGRDLLSMSEANRLVMRDVVDGVLVVDGDGVIKQGNSSAEQLLKCHITSGMSLHRDFGVIAAEFERWQRSEENSMQLIKLASGYQTRLRFVTLERDPTHGAVIFIEDMQRIQAQAQQIKLAALGRLTASIAHEIRNPLSSISYATELLQEDALNAQQQKLLTTIFDNAQRINHIVHDIMQLNRRDRVEKQQFELNSWLSDFIHEFIQAEHLDSGLFLLRQGQAVTIRFDQGHLRQVLWNLCRNAVRHSCRLQHSVRLTIHRKQDHLWLDIEDDGEGVPQQFQAQLFEPFFTTASDGNGLGLYIARELCEANSAHLSYQDDREGACFRIDFLNAATKTEQ